MNIVLEQINTAGRVFVDFAWPMLLQSSVLIAILLFVDFLLRRKVRAVFRYWLWMLVVIKLVLPTSLSSPVSIGRFVSQPMAVINITENERPVAGDISNVPNQSLNTEGMAESRLGSPPTSPIHSQSVEPAASLAWQGGVLLVWLAVVVTMLLLLLQRAFFVCGLVRQSGEANDLMKDMLGFCCKTIGVRGQVGLKVSPNATSPAVCGLFRPVILLPYGLGSNLGSGQFRVVLMHELAHIKRGDLWVNLVQTLLQIAYFYNPLLWLANWVIRRVREQAVDEVVQVSLGEKAQQYPETLLNVARLVFERPALSLRLVGVVESKSALTGRIKRMLIRPIPKTAKLGIIGSVALIFLAAVLLPMAKAQKPVISAAEFGDSNGTNAGKENRMSKPEKTGPPVAVSTNPAAPLPMAKAEKTGGQTMDEQNRGEQIIKKMTEVNRYWLIGPPAEVKNYSYDFALYQDEARTYKVTEPSSADRTKRQGITYDSILHKLAKESSAATYTAIEEANGTIKLDFKLTDSGVSIGNGINGWRGYFSRKVDGGAFWIDAQKMVPLRSECNKLYEYFSDYTAVDETHYVPLIVKIDQGDMHFDWTFKLHKPGLWLFDRSRYLYDKEGQEPIIAASISNVRINGELSDQSTVVVRDVNKPRVISVWPADGATGVEPVTEIRIRFDRPMNPDQTNFRWKEGQYRNIESIRYDAALREYVIPVELEGGCKHRIIVNEWSAFRDQRQKGFVDVDGMDAEEFEWSFSTKGVVLAADAAKPKVVSVSLASGSKIALVSELKIVFDQPITAQWFNLELPGTETKSSWPRTPQVLRQNVRYNADKTEFTVPMAMPPDWDGAIELSGFVNAGGAEAEPIVLRYSTQREVFSPELLQRLKDAAKSQKLIDVLEAVRNTRLNIKSLSETVQTVWDFGKDGKTARAIFKMQGDRQFFVDITERMGTPFVVGSDGQNCWFYHKGKQEELVTVPFEQMHDKYVSICDYARVFELGITGAIEDNKIEYVGEDLLDGRKCHLIRSWGLTLESDYLWGSIKVGWIDVETNLLAQVIDDIGIKSSVHRFYYDRINEPIPDSEFSPKSFTDVKPSEPSPLDDKYDTRILGIVDGSSGVMKIYWGEKGPGGTRSNGLN